MSMTKAEKARVEDLERELAIHKALAWPGYLAPDRMPPPRDGYVTGFRAIVSVRLAVSIDQRWSEIYRNGAGLLPPTSYDIAAARGGASLYRTRVDALMAARVEVTRTVAEELAKLDAEIAAERGKTDTPSDGEGL